MILAVSLLLVGCGQRGVRYAEGPRTGPVVVLGDSLSAGLGVADGEGYVELLAARTGLDIVNLGKSGATTEESVARVAEEVLPLEPALVLLQLGGNDALQKVEPEVTKSNLNTMIDELHGSGVPVILLGVRGGLFSDRFEKMFREVAADKRLGLVPDLLDGILTDPKLKLDSVHPNALGHRRLADRVQPELERVVALIGLPTSD